MSGTDTATPSRTLADLKELAVSTAAGGGRG